MAEAYDKNFASILQVFDRMFGACCTPGSAIDVPTGIADNPANDFLTQTPYPFRKWAQMLRARGKAPEHAGAVQTIRQKAFRAWSGIFGCGDLFMRALFASAFAAIVLSGCSSETP